MYVAIQSLAQSLSGEVLGGGAAGEALRQVPYDEASAIYSFASGAVAMGFAIAGLYFLKFFRRTNDRLFAMFAAAFWILAINRVALVFAATTDEARTYLYGVRLLAFLLILLAIIDKNRAQRAAPAEPESP